MRSGRLRRALRVIAWILGGLLCVVAAPFVAALHPGFRQRLAVRGLELANARMSYQVQLAQLDRVDPWGIEVRGVRLFDAQQRELGRVSRVAVSLRPGSLLFGQLRLTRAEIEGLTATIPERSAAPAEPEQPETNAEEASDFEVRVDELSIRSASVDVKTGGKTYRASVQRFEGGGRWGPTPAIGVEQLTLRGEVDGREALVLAARDATFRVDRGGAMRLQGTLGGAPIALSAQIGPLPTGDAWPVGQAELHIERLDRRALTALGIADGGGLQREIGLALAVRSSGERVSATARISAGEDGLELRGTLTEQLAELDLDLTPVALASISDVLPALGAQGHLRARYALAAEPAALEVSWRAVKLDREVVPDGALAAFVSDSVVELRSLALAGFERKLALSGRWNFETSTGSARLALRNFQFAQIPWLASLGMRGTADTDLALATAAGAELAADGQLSLRDFAYAKLSAAAVTLDLALTGKLDAPQGKAKLAIDNLKADELALARLSADFRGTPRRVDAQLSAEGPDTSFRAQLTGTRASERALELSGTGDGKVFGRPLTFRARVAATEAAEAQVAEVQLKSRDQLVVASARLDRPALDARAELSGIDLAVWAPLIGMDDLSGRIDGFVHVTGKPERPRGNLKLTLAGLHAQGQGPFDASLDLDADFVRGSVSTHVVVSSEPQQLSAEARAQATFRPRPLTAWRKLIEQATYQLTLRGRVPVERVAPYAGPQLAALQGVIDATLEAGGTLDEPKADLAVRARLGLPAEPDKLSEALRLDLNIAPTEGSLQLGLSDLQGELLNAQGRVAWPTGSLRGALVAEAVERLPEFQLRAQLAQRRLDTMQGVFAYLAGAYAIDLPMRASADVDLRGKESELSGVARAEFVVYGDKLDANCALGTESTIKLDAELEQQRVKLKVKAHTLDGGEVNGELATSLARDGLSMFSAARFHAKGEGIQLPKLPGLCDLRSGTAKFDLDAENLGAGPPRIALDLTVDDLRKAKSEGLAVRLRAGLDAKLAQAKGEFVVKGKPAGVLEVKLPVTYPQPSVPSLASDAAVTARLRVTDLPLAPFMAFGEKLGAARGRASADLRIGGTLARPKPSGYIEAKDVAFSISSLAQPLRDINGRVEIDDHKMALRGFTARDLGGRLRFSGEAQLRDDLSGAAKLRLEADKFPLRRQGVVVGELTAAANVSATVSHALSTDVDVKVESGRIWLTGDTGRDVQALEPHASVRFVDAPAEEVEEVEQEEGAGEQASFSLHSLHLQSEREIWLMHTDFSVQLGFDIRLAQGEQGPQLLGEAAFKRGEMKLLGKPFSIEKGAIRFTGDFPPDPELDLRASFEPSSGEALVVQVTGRASAPALTFSGAASTAGEAMAVLSGVGQGSGADRSAQADAAAFAANVTAGLLSVTARREFGDWVPMLSVETDASGTPSRARAGFDATNLIPPFLDDIAKGAYVEGIVGSSAQSGGSSVGLGVRLELAFPWDLITTFGYGPGPNWSTDLAWAP